MSPTEHDDTTTAPVPAGPDAPSRDTAGRRKADKAAASGNGGSPPESDAKAGSDGDKPSAAAAVKVSAFAVPLLGIMGAIQGADPNIASTALVGASRSLNMSSGLVALAASISTLALAASVISTGLLADRLGRRKVLVAALIVAAVGDLIVVISPVSTIYLVGRAIAGIGLGAVFGASFAYIRAVAPPGQIPKVVGLFTAVTGATTVVMTFAGGQLSGIEWRTAFLMVPIVSIACAFAVPFFLPKEPKVTGENMDVPGQILLALGVVAFLYGISHLGTSLAGPLTLGPLVGGIVLLGLFFWHEHRSDKPFFPVRLFTNPVFIAAVCLGFVYNFTNAISFLQLTDLWQYVLGLKTSAVSIWQLPLLIAGILVALLFSRLMAKGLGNSTAALIGTVCSATGLVLLAVAHGSETPAWFMPGGMLAGGGLIIASLPFGNLILREAPPKFFGPVTSSRTTLGQFFYAMGLALGTVIINRLTTGGILDRLKEAGVPPTRTGEALDAVTAYAHTGTDPSNAIGRTALADAATSYRSSFAIAMVITAGVVLVVGLVGTTLIKRDEVESEKDDRKDLETEAESTAPAKAKAASS